MQMSLQRKEQALQVLKQGFVQANPTNRDSVGIVELSHLDKKIDIESLEIGNMAKISNSKVSLDIKVEAKQEL